MSAEEFYEAVDALIEMGLIELIPDDSGDIRMLLTDRGAQYVTTHNYSYRTVA